MLFINSDDFSNKFSRHLGCFLTDLKKNDSKPQNNLQYIIEPKSIFDISKMPLMITP